MTTQELNAQELNARELGKPYRYAALVGLAAMALTAVISLFG